MLQPRLTSLCSCAGAFFFINKESLFAGVAVLSILPRKKRIGQVGQSDFCPACPTCLNFQRTLKASSRRFVVHLSTSTKKDSTAPASFVLASASGGEQSTVDSSAEAS